MTKLFFIIGQVIYAILFSILIIPLDFLFVEIIKFSIVIMLILMLPFMIISLYWKNYNADWQKQKDWCKIDKNI